MIPSPMAGQKELNSEREKIYRIFSLVLNKCLLSCYVLLFCINWSITVDCAQILETAFKKETVGLVTREQYVEKVLYPLSPFFWIFGLLLVDMVLSSAESEY